MSIAQILISVLTCAVLDVFITIRRQRVIAWPASALLTGNGIALLLRVTGTRHGDWWSFRGWWIFAATGAVGIASKHLIRRPTGPVFNPSNIALVLCFALLGTNRVNPQDLWWGPPSPGLYAVQAVIVIGGLLLLLRLRLVGVSAAFWLTFVAGLGVVALSGHAMTARWHVGTVSGATYWWILATSPEVLIFLFFMLTDPQTLPRSARDRAVFGASVGVLAALFAAAAGSEFGTKLALLAALAVACVLRPVLERELVVRLRPATLTGGAFVALLAVMGHATSAGTHALVPAFQGEVFLDTSSLPPIAIDPMVSRAGANVTPLDAQRLVAQAIATLNAEPGRTYTVTNATVVLVYDTTRPQSPPKLGVRVMGTMRDRTGDTPFDRTI